MYKYTKICFMAIPVVFSLMSLAIVTLLWLQSPKKTITTKENIDLDDYDIYNKLKIFPQVHDYDFYKDLKISNNKAIIDNQMIANIINFVINNIQIPYGNLQYSYEQKNAQTLKISFSWLPKNYESFTNEDFKNYSFFITNLLTNRNRGPLLNQQKKYEYSYFFKVQ